MMREGRNRAIWLLACASAALFACGNRTHENGVGGETNWLRACDVDSECALGSCVCGLCSEGCADDTECPEGLRCETLSSTLYANACGGRGDVRGLCAPRCGEDGDCGAAQVCADGACMPGARLDGGAIVDQSTGAASSSNTGPRLLVDAHLDLTPECLPNLDKPIGSGAGTFDLRPAGSDAAPGMACSKPYMLVLRVANPFEEDVLVTGHEVQLMTIEGERIVFNRLGPEHPNPHRISLTGSVPARVGSDNGVAVILAEAIPTDYAEQLDQFVGGQILIRSQLEAETLSGARVGANPFEYRVTLCYGCLTACLTDVLSSNVTLDDVTSGVCGDRAGADGRYCIDDDC